MKKLLLILVIFIMTISSSFSQIKITFVVTTSGIDKSASVYITGNDSSLGEWNPASVKMNKINDSTWSKTLSFAASSQLEFKFTKGSWESEALTENGLVPSNNMLLIRKDTMVNYSLRKWKDQGGENNQARYKGQITGTVKYIKKMEGKGIKPRDIVVWLPPTYSSDTAKRYPVLYMHDGQNIFDPKTSSFGVDWQLDETADSLIKAGLIRELIIVGIYNTPDRSAEYGDTPLGYKYMDFIINNLKPYIDKNFRTLPDRVNTATGGSSLGGLISFMLIWEHPEVFSQAACLSPAFHIADINYVRVVDSYSGPKKPLRIYIDVGTVELDSSLKPGSDEMVSELIKKGYNPDKDLNYFIDEGAAHNESAWAKRNWRYLEFLFGK